MSTHNAPIGVAAGVHDLGAAVGFFTQMGYEEGGRGTLDRAAAQALYGVSDPVPWVEVGSPETARGQIRLLAAPATVPAGPPAAPVSLGLYAVDVYATDMTRTLSDAQAAGAEVVGRAEYDLGATTMEEGAVVVPGGLRIVFIAMSRRRPSVLDRDPSRSISEPYSAVCVVQDAGAAQAFLEGGFGLRLLHETRIDDEKLAELMGLDAERAAVHMVLMANQDQDPLRVEILQFLSPPLSPAPPATGLVPGYAALLFSVEDLQAAAARFDALGCTRLGGPVSAPSIHLGATLEGLAFTGPQGIRFELWGPPAGA